MAKTNDAIHSVCAAEEFSGSVVFFGVGARVGAVEVEGASDGVSLDTPHCAGLAKGVYLTGPSAVT
jgi:hypothetical protein